MSLFVSSLEYALNKHLFTIARLLFSLGKCYCYPRINIDLT